MSNINSFAENINKLVENTNNSLSILQTIDSAMLSEKSSTSMTLTAADGSTESFTIPGWNYMNSKLTAISNSLETIMNGTGIISVDASHGRYVKLTDIAEVPSQISGLTDPSMFSIDADWWFENMMFPCAQVTVDLRNKIGELDDRVLVDRVILSSSEYYDIYVSDLMSNRKTYSDLIDYLNTKGIKYTEDKEILNLSLVSPQKDGTMSVTGVTYLNDVQWLTLDTIEYRNLDKNTGNTVATSVLKVGDMLSSGSFLYTITDIDIDSMRISVEETLGYSMPNIDTVFHVYNELVYNKYANVRFGSGEIDIVYFKGINRTFNMNGSIWSEPVQFITDNLLFSEDSSTLFSSYYKNNIADFGQKMLSDLSENKISYVGGKQPSAPSISSSYFSVVQINTQINAALDTDSVKSLESENESTKSTIDSLKSTIESQQTDLQSLSGTDYSNLLKSINSNISQLQGLQVKYKTSLSELQTLLKENNGIDYTPKYHIRGFFPVPADVILSSGTVEHIIGFETEYRYIKEDATGVALKTYTYTDSSGNEHTGVYSDWNIISSSYLIKEYDSTTGTYQWENNTDSDGTVININQIDIPISKGEKVEFRVRSVSEAGYPYSPLKSAWSSSVIMSFPANLSSSSEIENIITDINDENVELTIEQAFTDKGVDAHLSDTIANTNSTSGVYFKHKAENIAYNYKDPSSGVVTTISLQDALDKLFTLVNAK